MKNSNDHADKLSRLERLEEKLDTPIIPESVYHLLPEILKEGTKHFSVKREQDIFLLGSFTLLSGAMPNVYGYYDRRKIYCPLYLLIIAPPASGKGVLMFSRNYLSKIEEMFRDQFKTSLSNYFLHKKHKEETEIQKPKQEKLIVPANSSSASFMRNLNLVNGRGIIFETEADTLSATLKNDWGNYSDIIRKSFQHESITSSRLDDEGNIEISEPKLAILLSGTYDQVSEMKLDNPLNGLQSRFLFYLFDSLPYFKDVSPFAQGNNNFDFKTLGESFLPLYLFLVNSEHQFVLSRNQWRLFNRWFSIKMDAAVRAHNMYAAAMLTRLGVSAFRILMVLSTLRSFENGLPTQPITCTNEDLTICHHLMETLFAHSMAVFSQSTHSQKDQTLSKYLDFLNILPNDTVFTRKVAIELATGLFAERTIDRRLAKLVKNGCLYSPANGHYLKVKR